MFHREKLLSVSTSSEDIPKRISLRKRIRISALIVMVLKVVAFVVVIVSTDNEIATTAAVLGLVWCTILFALTLRAKQERDITEIRLVEINEQLLRYTHLHSHELRGPLARVLGLIYVCKMAPKPIDYNWYLDKIEAEAFEVDRVLRMMRSDLNSLNLDGDSTSDRTLNPDNFDSEDHHQGRNLHSA